MIDWINILFLAIGATFGFFGTIGIEAIKRHWKKKDRKENLRKILESVKREIEEGIKRSKALIGFAKNKKISFSRIYITLWDSVRFEICQTLEDDEILRCLHQIYYRFDLINFNMEHERFEVGAAFAKKYIDEMEKSFKIVREKIETL